MNNRARAFSTTAIAAFALAIGLAGCSTLPNEEASAAGGVACLNLRSTVTNLEALRAWCLDHHDAAGAAGWLTGIENSLKADTADTATSGRILDAVSRLDEQVTLLSSADPEAAIAQLPDVINKVVDELKPARDAVCA